MMKDVWISISNRQHDGGKEENTLVFDTAGYYFFDDGVGVLSYQESELTGLEDSWDNQKVIVEVEDPWTMQLVSRVIEHKESHGKSYIVPVSVDHILGQILSQFSIMPELNLVALIGSVRNTNRINSVMRTYRPDIVFHAAAHKHVPLMEDSPCEAIKNNAIGTYKTAYAAMMHGCERFVLISTDKAVNPTNIMGASKRMCEMIIQSFDRKIKEGKADELTALHVHTDSENEQKQILTSEPGTEFVAVRFGNVLGSNGSVIPIFKKQIEKGGPVTVTHPDIIRYGAYRDKEDMENIKVAEIKGITFAFLGYTEHTNGLSHTGELGTEIVYLDELDVIEAQIKQADEIADVVIVSPHFGTEVSNEVSDSQRELSQKFADWGADIIIGTQPHTIQECNWIERSDGSRAFVYYCLGNLVSAMADKRTMIGGLGEITIVKDMKTGEITLDSPKIIPIITHYGSGYSDITIYPYTQYNETLASSHGLGLSMDYIEGILSYVPKEFIWARS